LVFRRCCGKPVPCMGFGTPASKMTAAGASDDAAEGIAAFAAKRPSAFRGR
jgi:hypothetical protein